VLLRLRRLPRLRRLRRLRPGLLSEPLLADPRAGAIRVNLAICFTSVVLVALPYAPYHGPPPLGGRYGGMRKV
jgi:hypothetical protein